MSNYISTRSCTRSGYIRALSNALENSLARMRYYEESDETRFLEESNEWLEVASLYMKEIKNAQTCEA